VQRFNRSIRPWQLWVIFLPKQAGSQSQEMLHTLLLDKKLGHRCGQLNALGSLVYQQDKIPEQRYLVDTVAAVSVFPHHSSAPSSGWPLAGANGWLIASWGRVTKNLCFGQQEKVYWG